MYLNLKISYQALFRLIGFIIIFWGILKLLSTYNNLSSIMIIIFGFFFALWQVFNISESFSLEPVTYDTRSIEELEDHNLREKIQFLNAAENQLLVKFTQGEISGNEFKNRVEVLEGMKNNTINALPQQIYNHY